MQVFYGRVYCTQLQMQLILIIIFRSLLEGKRLFQCGYPKLRRLFEALRISSFSVFILRLLLPIFSNGRQIFLWQFITQEQNREKRKNQRGSVQLQGLTPDVWKLLISSAFGDAAVTRRLSIFSCLSQKICIRLTIWLLEGRYASCFVPGRVVCTACKCREV